LINSLRDACLLYNSFRYYCNKLFLPPNNKHGKDANKVMSKVLNPNILRTSRKKLFCFIFGLTGAWDTGFHQDSSPLVGI